jgi:Na+/H+ antiporter NhaA
LVALVGLYQESMLAFRLTESRKTSDVSWGQSFLASTSITWGFDLTISLYIWPKDDQRVVPPD